MIVTRDGEMCVEWRMSCDPYQVCYIGLNEFLLLVEMTQTEAEFRAELWNSVAVNDQSRRIKRARLQAEYRRRKRSEAEAAKAAAAAFGAMEKAKDDDGE